MHYRIFKVVFAIYCLLILGCSSTIKNHQGNVERLYSTHEKISAISDELRNIEQIMLYVGRLKDSPLADQALDVAIAINGEPDEIEKLYAQNITPSLIEKDMKKARKLSAQLQQLQSKFSKEKVRIFNNIAALNELEAKYEFVIHLASKVAIGIAFVLVLAFIIKFLF